MNASYTKDITIDLYMNPIQRCFPGCPSPRTYVRTFHVLTLVDLEGKAYERVPPGNLQDRSVL
jgi:hypothetical protein